MTEFKLLLALNRLHLEQVTQQVIIQLKCLNGEGVLLSGDDSGLRNTWEEICVQVEKEKSFYWEVYQTTINEYCESELRSLPQAVYDLISYIGSINDDVDLIGKSGQFTVEDGVRQIASSVLVKAGTYTNENIEKFIDPPLEEDDEDSDIEEDQS